MIHQTCVRDRVFRAILLAAGSMLAFAHAAPAQLGGPMLIRPARPVSSVMASARSALRDAPLSDETLLRSVGISTDGPGLLEFFRLRGQGEAKPERLAALIEQLGDKSPLAARKAMGELASLGASAIPSLIQAKNDPDLHQTFLLATRCLKAQERPGQLSTAAARLIAQRRPRGSAEALLNFLPLAEDDGVVEEIRLALEAVAHLDGKANPALVKALRDQSPIRRALALDVLCRHGINAALLRNVPLRQLLNDRRARVRLRAALALGRARDAKAVSTLIALLSELPLQQARQAEDFLAELAGDQAPKTAMGDDDASRKKGREDWSAWWRNSEDGERLLNELRKRTPSDAVRRKCAALIQQLGDSEFSVREKAQSEVKAMGVVILPLLREAVHHSDLEVRRRAQRCLGEMQRDKNLPLSPTTPRLIALRKPVGAAEALLAYVPYASSDEVRQQVQLALNAVALTDEGSPRNEIVRALTDELAPRRAAAAEALCLSGDRQHLPAVRALLHDDDAQVRLQTALALAGIGQRDAVPTLIDLLGELPSTRTESAEEYLIRLANDKTPEDLPSGDNEADRKKRRDIWAAWWKANGEAAVLVERYPPADLQRERGYTLLVLANIGQIVELDRNHKTRWTMTGLANPRDALVVAPNRILVAEHGAQRVSERDRKGKILWQKQVPGAWPLAVQRLRNGHTFIICQNRLLEVDRGGRDVFSIERPQNDVVMARKMRNGHIVLVSAQRQCLRLDATGKQLKSFPIQWVWQHNAVDILDNGHIVVPHQNINRVIEYDANGKSVFEATTMQPTSVCRLPHGRTLIASQRLPAKVLVMDAAGKKTDEFAAPNLAFRIRRR